MIAGLICHFWVENPILSGLYGISASHSKELEFYVRNTNVIVYGNDGVNNIICIRR